MITAIAPIENAINIGLASLSMRDDFNQGAGALTGKTLDLGGTWSGAGDADDFTLNTTAHKAQRTATSDVDGQTGRYAIAGTKTFTDVAAKVDVSWSEFVGISGLLLRYVDTGNWLRVIASIEANLVIMSIQTRVGGGAVTALRSSGYVSVTPSTNYDYRLQALVDRQGRVFAYFGTPGGPVAVTLKTQSAGTLGTGGALASGKVGIYDVNLTAYTGTRSYDNFAAWVPTTDAAIYANQSAYIRSDGSYRESADGVSVGPIANPTGNLLRLPISGDEGCPVEIMVKASRGDFDQMPDTAIDDISARITYRPCWLTVPGS